MVVDQMLGLVQFFKDGRSSMRKDLSYWGCVRVVKLQTVLLKSKCLQHVSGTWVAGASEGMELFRGGRPIFYDPTNFIWDRLWKELWGNVPGLGDLAYNDETLGDTLEAMTSVYVNITLHGRINRARELPLSDACIQWFMETGMDLLSQLSALLIWEMEIEGKMLTNDIGSALTAQFDLNKMD